MNAPEHDPMRVERMLDDLARTPTPDPSDDLMARILGDAQVMLPAPGGVAVAVPWWRQVVQGLGGWGTVGGLVAAAATGFVIGLGGLDATGVDALWVDVYFDGSGALDAFGWDFEEG